MIKVVPILLLLFLASKVFSQCDIEKKIQYYTKNEHILIADNEKKIFLKEAKPSPESELSIYLKSKLTEKDLKKINYINIQASFKSNPLKYKTYDYTIKLSFEVDKKNNPRNYRVSTGNYELNKKIKGIFKNYPIEKLNLSEKNKRGKNIVQLFSREKKKTIINASNFVVLDEKPTIELCDTIRYNSKRSSCFQQDLENYIFENISLKELAKQKLRGEIRICTRFSIDSTGNIYKVKCEAPNDIIEEELNRIVKLYNRKLIPAKRNGIPINYFFYKSYYLQLEEN